MQSECMPCRTLARVQLAPSSALIMTPCPIVPTRMLPFFAMAYLLERARCQNYTPTRAEAHLARGARVDQVLGFTQTPCCWTASGRRAAGRPSHSDYTWCSERS